MGSAGAANATTWHDGDMLTYTQADWGDVPNGTNIASVFEANYSTVYAPFGVFQVRDLNGFTMFFGSAATVLTYLPASGPVGALNADLIDPTLTSAGEFGGDVAAARLDLDFDDAGLVHGTAGVHFGDLSLYGLTATPDLDGLTVRQAIAALESALAGLPTNDTYADLDTLARDLEASFFVGSPSTFAQDHLAAPVPEPATGLLVMVGVLGLAVARRKASVSA
ncbi:MAG TPA: PEP-CTERM sorting domain-containing protein [Myxococcota bacterium]|nr:PEP-CTERM sorting domain-containing protein [Myxococcota bacterium]